MFFGKERLIPFQLKLQCLFGQRLSFSGWLVLAFGSVFAWAFAGAVDLHDMTGFNVPTAKVVGEVTGTKKTGYSENKRAVVGYNYKFEYIDNHYEDTSYSKYLEPQVGSKVEVEFTNPNYSRIVGMRRGIMPPGMLLILILPGIGIVLIWFGVLSGLKDIKLLTLGVQATAKVISIKDTGMKVNRRTVRIYELEYPTREGRSARGQIRSSLLNLSEDSEEQILYDPTNTSWVKLLDLLPAKVTIDSKGEIGFSPRLPLYLIAPFLTVAGNLIYLVFRFSK